MARCPECGAEAPDGARYCQNCGAPLARQAVSPEQHPLPFSPWGPPRLAPQMAGAAGRAEPMVGPPLTVRQIIIAVGAVLLFLVFMVFIAGRGLRGGSTPSRVTTGVQQQVPVVGMKGEPIHLGNTVWGVAFTDTTSRFDNRAPQHGQFYIVGVVVGNRSEQGFMLTNNALALTDAVNGTRFTPVLTAWGTPEQLDAGQYRQTYALPPREAIAGLVVFDAPPQMDAPRLLVRDMTTDSAAFTGAIDLTKETP